MRKVLSFLVAVGFIFSIGSAPMQMQLKDTGNDWDDLPDVFLPVRTK